MPILQDAPTNIHASLDIQTYKNRSPDTADKKLDTRLVNVGHNKRYTLGAISSVIQRASSLVFDSVEAKKRTTHNHANGELFCGRRGTLTHFSLQQVACELESGAGCVLLPCRATAVANSILAFVGQDDHALMTNTAYEPSQNFCSKILNKLSVTTSWFDSLIDANIVERLQPSTKIVLLKSPGPITMEVHDVLAIVTAIRNAVPDAIITIDNTWVAGVLFKALDLGIDVSIQAATKYLVGHSNTVIGTTVCNTRCWEQLRKSAYLMGQMVDADTAYITSRGLCILGVRLRQRHESSLKVVEWLAEHPQVARVNHPALPGNRGHGFWERNFTGSSGLSSFVLKERLNDEKLANYLDNSGLFSMAYSWNGYELLIPTNQPEHITAIRPQDKIGFSGALIHLYIGLEDVDDLIAGLDAGFARIV